MVDVADLAPLDRRERNYDRRDVSAHLDGDGPVWAYLASAAGRERFAAGCAAGTAVVGAGVPRTGIRPHAAPPGAARAARYSGVT